MTTEVSCDLCVAPGMCCKAFHLSIPNIPAGSTPQQVKALLDQKSFEPLPFEPLRRTTLAEGYDPKAETESWLFNCPKLRKNGRCGIYRKRPETCRIYEAGSDPMCVHYVVDGKPLVPQFTAKIGRTGQA